MFNCDIVVRLERLFIGSSCTIKRLYFSSLGRAAITSFIVLSTKNWVWEFFVGLVTYVFLGLLGWLVIVGLLESGVCQLSCCRAQSGDFHPKVFFSKSMRRFVYITNSALIYCISSTCYFFFSIILTFEYLNVDSQAQSFVII